MNTHFLESFISDKLSETALPGLSLALVKDGKVVYTRGFGQRDVEYGYPATPDTLYSMGSVTKSFTALAILRLAEAEKLSLDDSISQHVPFTVQPRGQPIRIKHLLSHTTGIPALAYAEAILSHANGKGGKALAISGPADIMTFAADAEAWVEAIPGERWFYFNEGYAMLGQIIEQVSGLPYADYIKMNILAPLGMNRSFFSKQEVDAADNVAVPYTIRAKEAPQLGRYLYRSIRSEGGLISSVVDLSKYIMMYIEGGKGIISQSSLTEMWQPRVSMPWCKNPGLFGHDGDPQADTHYAYGLVSEDFYGETLLGHSGSVSVATAHLAFLPDSKVGVALLTNGSGYPTAQFAKVALAVLLEKDVSALPFMRVENDLSALMGTYESYKGTMTATVSKQADFLKLDLQEQEIILVPETLGQQNSSFFTLAGGRRLPLSFHKRNGTVELIYERYKLKRTGP